jgi:hypothetical protein
MEKNTLCYYQVQYNVYAETSQDLAKIAKKNLIFFLSKSTIKNKKKSEIIIKI